MKIYIPYPKSGIGGGHTFVSNFLKGLPSGVKVTHNVGEDWNILFIANPMHGERKDFKEAVRRNAKIICRTDNIPEDSHNRGTAISRLKDFIPQADAIIYQSNWSLFIYQRFMECNKIETKARKVVIKNGVDTSIFKPEGDTIDRPSKELVVLHVKSSRTENKRYPAVVEYYRQIHYRQPNSRLWLLGKFSRDMGQYNFGFYNGENVEYLGVSDDKHYIASLMRSADVLLYPSFADACSNTILEAQACHLPVLYDNWGGNKELVRVGDIFQMGTIPNKEKLDTAKGMFEDYKPYSIQAMVEDYIKEF